eukprot:s8591_g1.t1
MLVLRMEADARPGKGQEKPNTRYEHREFYFRNHNVCAANADDTNVNTIRNKNVRAIKDYVEIGEVMLPYALLCANHVLNEFYNAFGVTGENYTEAYRNGGQNTENQESQSLESGYAPRFAQSKGIAENILKYEERIEQYEKATGEKVQENLKVSTLIDEGMKPEVKRHLLLNLDEKTKYTALRQYLVNYESTERWTNSLAQQGTPHRTTTDLIDKGEDHGGLAAMDINQAWFKGKDFGKGFGFDGTSKRMVSMYHMGDQPTSFPEQFDLSEDSEEIEVEYFGRVLRVIGEEVQEERIEFEEFWIGDEDDEFQECQDVFSVDPFAEPEWEWNAMM